MALARVQVHVRLDPDLYERFVRLAAKRGISVNALMVEAAEEKLRADA